MAITIQNYEWRLTGESNIYGIPVFASAANYPEAGVDYSIFVGPYGNRIEIPPFVSEDQFVVIEKFGSTAGVLAAPTWVNFGGVGAELKSFAPNGFLQIVINTTGYYQDPQHTWQKGISGDAAPYPYGLNDVPPSYVLEPPIYVLPEQTWDLRYTMMNDLRQFITDYNDNFGNDMQISYETVLAACHVQYHLFDGPDSLICHQLLELGIPITVENAEWYRKMLLQSRGLDTETWEHYLNVSEAYRQKEKKNEELAGRERKA